VASSPPSAGSAGADSTPSAVDAKAAGIVFGARQDATWLVVAVDPASGRATEIASFLPTDDDMRLDADFVQMAGGGPLAERALYSSDLTRAAATNRATEIPGRARGCSWSTARAAPSSRSRSRATGIWAAEPEPHRVEVAPSARVLPTTPGF
jgi:hypothetical protein